MDVSYLLVFFSASLYSWFPRHFHYNVCYWLLLFKDFNYAVAYTMRDWCLLSAFCFDSSSRFFLIGVPKLTYHLQVLSLVQHCRFPCLLLVSCSHQIRMLLETWCKSLACCFKVLCSLDSSVEPLLVMRMLLICLYSLFIIKLQFIILGEKQIRLWCYVKL